MSKEAPNLMLLQKTWLLNRPAERGLRRVERWTGKRLAHLLRHHDEKSISNSETWLRDDVDYLLGFYAILEIALMIRFVEDVSVTFQKRHAQALSNPALRRYYEWNYPLDLPRRLRERFLFGVGFQIKRNVALHVSFYEFLDLTQVLERDSEIESFLWALDGGRREDKDGVCDIDAVIRSLKSPTRFIGAIRRKPDRRSELDRALNGFCKFVQFCEALDLLIERLKSEPRLAEAMWLAHAYWFRSFESAIGEDLKRVVQSVARWQVKRGYARSLRGRIAEITALIDRLAAPPTTRWRIPVAARQLALEKVVKEVLGQMEIVQQPDTPQSSWPPSSAPGP
jgi:hypothetical protein